MRSLELDLRSLALLLQQQQPLASALQQISQRPGSQVWAQVAERIRQGANLAQALQGTPGVPPWLGSWIDQGSQTDCSQAMRAAAQCLAGLRQRRRAWTQLWLYPTLLWLTCLLIGRGILSLTPDTAAFLDEARPSLLALANQALLQIFPGLLLTPILLCVVLQIPALRIRLPLFGKLARLRDGLSVLRSLEFLVPGRTLPEALRLASQVCGLPPLTRQLMACATCMERGDTFAQALGSAPLLPPTVGWILIQAEQRSFEPRVIRGLSDSLESQIAFTQTFGWNLLYFAFYLYLGGLVLWFMASTFIPMFGMMAL